MTLRIEILTGANVRTIVLHGRHLEEPGSGPKWKLRMNFAVLLPRR